MRVFLRNEGTAFGNCTTRQHVIVMASAQELLEHGPKPDTVFIDNQHRIRGLHHRVGTYVHTPDGHTLEITSLDPLALRLLPLNEAELLTGESYTWITEHADEIMPLVAKIGPNIGKLRTPYGYPTAENEWTDCNPIRATLEELVGKFVILLNQEGKQSSPAASGSIHHVFYTSDKQFVRFIRAQKGRLYCERLTPVIDETAANAFFGPPEAPPEPPAKPKKVRSNRNGKSNDNPPRTSPLGQSPSD